MTVIKRNGEYQAFDANKIRAAVCKAFEACNVSTHSVDLIVDAVLPNIPDGMAVEQIQDLVEIAVSAVSPEVGRAYIRYRTERNLLRKNRLPTPTMAKGLADYIYASKYARWLPKLSRRETRSEIIARNARMHIRKFPALAPAITEAYKDVFAGRVLPSMRSMQFAGRAIESQNARMYNCAFTLIDRPTVFGDIFYLLLCGCGVGFSVQRQHAAKLPRVVGVDERNVFHYEIPDSIEGWATAVKYLFDSYFSAYCVEFSYAAIRPRGSQLHTTGGRAPGHLPLKVCLDVLRRKLDAASGRHLKPIECHDLICHIAEAVLAGGIRRSSLISLFTSEDGEMLYSKSPHEFQHGGLNAQRAMANNSAVFVRPVDRERFFRTMDVNKTNPNGEPGFFFTHNADHGCNPCGEIGLNPTIGDQTGFAFCNLTEVNVAACKTESEFLSAVESATIIGTLQASYTDFPFLGKVTESIARRDALLGVSLTGVADNYSLLTDDLLRNVVVRCHDVNAKWAGAIGIRSASRLTTVKPSGTASLALGCVGSGVHPHHARRYFRRVTANPLEPTAQHFRSVNPHMVETKPNGDWCLTFPVSAPDRATTTKDVTALQMLETALRIYSLWVKPGTRNDDDGLTHNVSCTIVFNEAEWPELLQAIYSNQDNVVAISFLPRMSDKILPFMPREAIVTEEDETKWNRLIRNYRPVNWHTMVETADTVSVGATVACSGEACEVVDASVVNLAAGVNYKPCSEDGDVRTVAGYEFRVSPWSAENVHDDRSSE